MPFDDLSPQQQEFCRKYLKYSSVFSSKEKKKQAEIDSEFEKYIRLKERVLQSIMLLAPGDTMVGAFRKRIDTNEETLTGKGKSKEKLAAANKELVVIQSDIEKHMKMEEVSRQKVSPEGQIRALGNKTQQAMVVELGKVEVAKNGVIQMLTKLAEGTDIVIETPPQWIEAQDAHRKGIFAITALCKPGAYTVDQARDALAKELRDFTTTAARLESELLALANDDSGMKKRVEAEKAANKLRDDLDKANVVIAELVRWDVQDATDLQNRSKDLGKLVVSTHPDLLTTTTTDVAALVKSANDIRQKQLTDYQQASAPLFQRMEALNKAVVQYNNDVKARRAAQLPQVEEASFLVTMSYDAYKAGKNMAALPGITKLVEDAEKLMFDLQNSVQVNGEVLKAIKLADETIKKHEGSSAIRKEAWKGHREALTKFEAEWTGMRPASAKSSVTDLVLKTQEEARIEAGMKQWREIQLGRVEATRKELAKLEEELKRIVEANGEKFKGYEGSLKADLDTCVEWINTKEAVSWQKPTETKIGQTQAKIMEMLNNLAGKGVDPTDPKKTGAELKLEAQKQLIDDHDESLKAKSDAEMKKKAFLEIADGWLVIAERDAKNSPRATEYKEEVERIFKQVSDMRKNVKKGTQDVETGKRSFDLLNRQFEELLQRPGKIDYTALGALGPLWAGAVSAFGKHVESLMKAVREGIPADQPETAKTSGEMADKLAKQLQVVLAGFSTTAFGEAAKVLGDETTAQPERKKAREVAQAAVRTMRAKLMDDPLMKACVANEFSVNGFGSDIYRALNQIELETLRGI
jgi:hypothetical protein